MASDALELIDELRRHMAAVQEGDGDVAELMRAWQMVEAVVRPVIRTAVDQMEYDDDCWP